MGALRGVSPERQWLAESPLAGIGLHFGDAQHHLPVAQVAAQQVPGHRRHRAEVEPQGQEGAVHGH